MDREMMGQVLDDLIPGDNTEIALRKATLRESRSSLAMTSLALSRLQAARAFASSGRAFRLPVSTSVNSAATAPPTLVRYCRTASCCASSPRPDRP